MITNDHQYRTTQEQAANFEAALTRATTNPDETLHPLLQKAQVDALRSQLDDLRAVELSSLAHKCDEEASFEDVQVTQEYITAYFSDNRIVSVPLWWSWRLEQATQEQRQHYEIIGAGRTVYWPDIDEHLSVQGFFIGTPAPRPLALRS